MNNKQGLAVALILVALILVGGLAYLFGQRSMLPAQDSRANPQVSETKNESAGNSAQENNPPVLTEAAALALVKSTWSDCSQGDCGGVEVAVAQNQNGQYVVTAIFTELDDSVSQTKRVSIATYQNGAWTLGQPLETRACQRGHTDGSQGFSSALCI